MRFFEAGPEMMKDDAEDAVIEMLEERHPC